MSQNYLNTYDKTEKIQGSALLTLLRNVYWWMTLALTTSGLAALFVAGNPGWVQLVYQFYLIFALAELGIVWYFSSRIMKISFATAGILFAVFSLLNGITLSFIFYAYELGSIVSTFFITAGTFGAMGLTGYFIKKDLSTLGRFFVMCLLGLIIASVVNWFMHSEGLYWLLTYAGVLIFCGLTAYDTQKIKQMLMEQSEVNESTMKLALLGSLTLYLDFINLFLYLLRIFANRR